MAKVSITEDSSVLDSMTDIVACLNTSDSIQRFLLDIHCILQKVTYADNFYVVLFKNNGELSFPYFHDVKDDIRAEDLEDIKFEQIQKTLTAYAIEKKTICNFTDAEINKLIESGTLQVLGTVPQQWLCFPLKNRNHFLGAFIIQSYRRNDEYSGVIVDVLYTISHVISSALDAFNNQQVLLEANQTLQDYQAELEHHVSERTKELQQSLEDLQNEVAKSEKLQQQLEYESLHDNLTNLANRKYLFKELSRLALKSERSAFEVYVLYLDLDDFKPINDEFGHKSGDSVLRTVAERLTNEVRGYDLVARIGGDEFVVFIMDPLHFGVLEQLCHRLLKSIQEPIQLEDGQIVKCGCSIGVAGNYTQQFSAENLLHQADQSLYAAKNKGKNQIHFAMSEQQ
ncbi:GGDEF domain-containing protein [Pseudoalteromonas phenolica]|uniref:GGDEF domain-containing protein n=1 Tax=Pseudoalteromonas phenolica TaxID=161398 RepID=A0A4Q7IJ42_9GAMM|nr:GGDEF domain-containing protein [Pseudoalteromonas phenolica]RZQ51605.1 GGDEF domain-containing protein [Pseudoalteromonas phenolica]